MPIPTAYTEETLAAYMHEVLGAGFRGSTFSVMLPLRPGADGRYGEASFLSAGGTLSAALPSPGTYLATEHSRINTVTIDPAPQLPGSISGAVTANGSGRGGAAGALSGTATAPA